MTTSTQPDLTVTRDVAAPAEVVWELISDLARMPEWSPENDKVEWLGGATTLAVGAKFRGSNHNGTKSWTSTGQITALEPGRRFSFMTSVGPIKVAEWGYEVAAAAGGSRITETWTDRRGGLMKVLSKFATGVDDRESHNRQGMEETLARMAVAAEGASA